MPIIPSKRYMRFPKYFLNFELLALFIISALNPISKPEQNFLLLTTPTSYSSTSFEVNNFSISIALLSNFKDFARSFPEP